MLNGNGELPAYPVRVACSHLAEADLRGEALLGALGRAVGVFYNYTGDARCLDTSQVCLGWGVGWGGGAPGQRERGWRRRVRARQWAVGCVGNAQVGYWLPCYPGASHPRLVGCCALPCAQQGSNLAICARGGTSSRPSRAHRPQHSNQFHSAMKQGANPETDDVSDFWSYQYCTEQFMPMGRDGGERTAGTAAKLQRAEFCRALPVTPEGGAPPGTGSMGALSFLLINPSPTPSPLPAAVNDMFWPQKWSAKAAARACEEQWGVRPEPLWATVQ